MQYWVIRGQPLQDRCSWLLNYSSLLGPFWNDMTRGGDILKFAQSTERKTEKAPSQNFHEQFFFFRYDNIYIIYFNLI